jgi:hypothetical protein
VTQLVFRVDAEEGNRDRWLDSVVLRVRDTRAVDRGSLELPAQVTNDSFPLEWGLLATDKDRGASIEVIAEGRRAGAVQSQQRALVSFVNDRVVRIDLFLARACTVQRVEYCRTLVPGVDLTCGREGQCELAQRTSGTALDRDAEASVSFADATAPDVTLAPPDAAQDSGVITPDATPADAAPRSDAAMDAPPADSTAPPPDAACRTNVVINEVQVFSASTAAYEYIELHNTETCAVSLDGWSLVAQLGATTPEVFRFNATHVIAPGGYLLIADPTTPGLPGTAIRWVSTGLGYFGDSVGGVRLLDRLNTPIDRVGWTDSAMVRPGLMYREFDPVLFPAAQAGAVLSRSPNGSDTDDNASDFSLMVAPSPGAPNR